MGEIHPNSQLTLRTSSAISNLAEFCKVSPDEVVAVLTSVVCPGATAGEMIAFAMVASAYELDPLKREIYAFKNKEGRLMAGLYVDGWISLMLRNPQFAGMQISYEDHPQTGMPFSCTVTIHRKDRPEFPTVITEYFDECRMPSAFHWQKWPRRQIRHKAIIQGVKVAFGVSGLGDMQEMQDRESNLAPVVGTRDRGSVEGLRKLGKPPAVDVVASDASHALVGHPSEEAVETPPDPQEADQAPPPSPPSSPEPAAADTSPPRADATKVSRGRQRREEKPKQPTPKGEPPPLLLTDEDIAGLLEEP